MDDNLKQRGVEYRIGAVHHCAPAWSWSPENMTDFDLWLVADGRGELVYADEDMHYNIRRSSCFLFEPGAALFASHQVEHPLTVLAIHFECRTLECRQLGWELARRRHQRIGRMDVLESLMHRAIRAGQLRNQAAAEVWLEAALLEMHSEVLMDPEKAGGYDEKIDRVCSDILAHPEWPWEVSELAEQCHVCVDHFIRIFQRRVGMTPKAFILHSRIDRACNLLLSSNLNIAQIAEAVGCAPVYYFSRLFKQRLGCTASQYRGGANRES